MAGLAERASLAAAVWLPWPAPDTRTAVAPAPPAPVGPDCSYAGLPGAAGGFVVMLQRLRVCQGAVDRDTALRLVEDGATRSDRFALLALAGLHGTAVADPVREGMLGLDAGDEPALAVEYYSRAPAAGAAEAGARLGAACQRLAPRSPTMSRGAHADYCR